MNGFGSLIERARLAAGMSPDELAQRLGRGKSVVYRLESEEQEPSVAQINALVAALPISAEELLRAMGVALNVPAASKLPKTLVDVLTQLEPEYQRTVEATAQGQLLLQRSRQGKGQP